jgi:hypothetical protein
MADRGASIELDFERGPAGGAAGDLGGNGGRGFSRDRRC